MRRSAPLYSSGGEENALAWSIQRGRPIVPAVTIDHDCTALRCAVNRQRKVLRVMPITFVNSPSGMIRYSSAIVGVRFVIRPRPVIVQIMTLDRDW